MFTEAARPPASPKLDREIEEKIIKGAKFQITSLRIMYLEIFKRVCKKSCREASSKQGNKANPKAHHFHHPLHFFTTSNRNFFTNKSHHKNINRKLLTLQKQ